MEQGGVDKSNILAGGIEGEVVSISMSKGCSIRLANIDKGDDFR